MTHATAPTQPSLADRLISLIEGLMSDVAACVEWRWLTIPVVVLLWRKLYRMKARFLSIVVRYNAGTLPAPGSAPARVRPSHARPVAPPPPLELADYRGWVARTVSRAFLRGWALEEMLEEPELADAVAVVPQLGRVLRPLCHMLGIKLPAYLRRPRRPRAPRPPKPKRILIRLGAGELWRGPTAVWPTRAEAQKFDAKTWVYPHELEQPPERDDSATKRKDE